METKKIVILLILILSIIIGASVVLYYKSKSIPEEGCPDITDSSYDFKEVQLGSDILKGLKEGFKFLKNFIRTKLNIENFALSTGIISINDIKAGRATLDPNKQYFRGRRNTTSTITPQTNGGQGCTEYPDVVFRPVPSATTISGTDKTNWPVTLPNTTQAVDRMLSNQSEFISYSTLKNFSYRNLKSFGGWINLNQDVLDTERPGILMGNFPVPAGNSNLNIEIHTQRNPRLYINGGTIDWRVNDQIPLNTWTHIAFVLKGDRIEYYRDGVLKQTRQGTPPILQEINNLKFGYDNRTGPFYAKFKLKNVLVGSTEWSASEFSKIIPVV